MNRTGWTGARSSESATNAAPSRTCSWSTMGFASTYAQYSSARSSPTAAARTAINAVASVISATEVPTRNRAIDPACSPDSLRSAVATERAVVASPRRAAPRPIIRRSRTVSEGSAAAAWMAGRTGAPSPARPASAIICRSRVSALSARTVASWSASCAASM